MFFSNKNQYKPTFLGSPLLQQINTNPFTPTPTFFTPAYQQSSIKLQTPMHKGRIDYGTDVVLYDKFTGVPITTLNTSNANPDYDYDNSYTDDDLIDEIFGERKNRRRVEDDVIEEIFAERVDRIGGPFPSTKRIAESVPIEQAYAIVNQFDREPRRFERSGRSDRPSILRDELKQKIRRYIGYRNGDRDMFPNENWHRFNDLIVHPREVRTYTKVGLILYDRTNNKFILKKTQNDCGPWLFEINIYNTINNMESLSQSLLNQFNRINNGFTIKKPSLSNNVYVDYEEEPNKIVRMFIISVNTPPEYVNANNTCILSAEEFVRSQNRDISDTVSEIKRHRDVIDQLNSHPDNLRFDGNQHIIY